MTHPLDPLSPDEISAATLAIRHHTAATTTIRAVRFVTCALLPPPKNLVLAALAIPLHPGARPEPAVPLVRKAESDFIDVINGGCYNAVVALSGGEWQVESLDRVADGLEPQITVEELLMCEVVVRNDPKVRALAKQVGIEPHQIYADGWAIGYDVRFPEHQRLQQAFLFARFSEHENLYAHPLDFIPVMDSVAEKVIHIDFPPGYRHAPHGAHELTVESTAPPPLSDAKSNRERIPPPLASFDFLPDLIEQTDPTYKPRDDLKPLHVLQPQGVSFRMHGHTLEWQKWKMHIAFHHREGVAISTVTYNDDGDIRPIFYRLSLAEMVVPYGSPEFPHSRKFAFDAGEYGMGTVANDLSLGCDCLGKIHYLPGAFVTHAGTAFVIKNAICIHEEDAGEAVPTPCEVDVVSMVCTVANYEYILNFMFYQDGNIELEIRLSGILQVYVAGSNEPSPHGVVVAPGVNAHVHQHIFSVRVDPMLDGIRNSVIESDIVSLDAPTGSKENFAGNGFYVKERVLKDQAQDGARDFDWAAERRWRIANLNRTHYASGKPSSYQIVTKGGLSPLLSKGDSWVARRASFAHKALWVVKDVEGSKGGRMWPSGKYVPQTREEPKDSVGRWVSEGQGSIDNEDIVLYLTVGTTHVPRPEDWPVMPVEHLGVLFKPSHFFEKNPSMDVPGAEDAYSAPAFANGHSRKGANGTNATCCGR